MAVAVAVVVLAGRDRDFYHGATENTEKRFFRIRSKRKNEVIRGTESSEIYFQFKKIIAISSK